MFKHAYVRGIQSALINSDAVAFPNEETANKIADHIADRFDIDMSKAIPAEVTRKVAQEVVAASDWIKKNQPNVKAASFAKFASWDEVRAAGDAHAEQVMHKAAEGSTIEGGDKGNKEPTSGEGKMDASARPEGYATNSLGKTDVDTKPGTVGKEEPQPAAPHESPSGSNSVVEHSRTASIADIFRKAAEGSTILGGDKGNKEPTTGEGKMDMQQRPEGYALLPSQGAPGAIPALVGGAAVVGKETPHPNGPNESPGGTNSLTEHSAKAASEDPYVALFKKIATEVVQYIPHALSEDEKIAHVRACMGMTLDEKARYLGQLQADVKEAAAAPVAPASNGRRYDGRNANQRPKSAEDGALPPFMKKDDDKKDDDKPSEEKKEAALRDHVARISAALRGAA
jgi:hypothetical protein